MLLANNKDQFSSIMAFPKENVERYACLLISVCLPMDTSNTDSD